MGDSSSSIIPTSSDEYHIVTALTIKNSALKYNFTDNDDNEIKTIINESNYGAIIITFIYKSLPKFRSIGYQRNFTHLEIFLKQ
jgi:hypothetical protein